ncbi:MAG: hypothetical protein ACK2UK_21190 [Candidatus Promineifilaceae bacterium]
MALVTAGSLILAYNSSAAVPTWHYIPYMPFELAIGLWLLFKGFSVPAVEQADAALSTAQ